MLCIGVFLYSCEDGNEKFNPNDVDTDYQAKDYLQDTKESLKQVTTVNTSDLPKTITLSEGVKITIPEGAFTKNGTPITGTFTVETYEMLKPSNMIFSGTNTNYHSGSYFESDGFIFIDVKQNGVSVDQQLSAPLTISIPTTKDDGTFTQLWIGNEEAGEDENQFAWEEGGEMDFWENGQEERGAFSKGQRFEFLGGKLGWINCDIFWGNTEMTTVTVKLYGQFGKLASYQGYEGDTFVFFRAKNVLVLAQLYTPIDNNTVKSYDNSMPVGMTGKLIGFSVKDGKFSYDEKVITITKDMSVDLTLKEITKDDLSRKIKALDTYK